MVRKSHKTAELEIKFQANNENNTAFCRAMKKTSFRSTTMKLT